VLIIELRLEVQNIWEKKIYKDDFQEYIDKFCVSSYKMAQEKMCLGEYFSGVGVFPVVVTSCRINYTGDYDDYIRSLTRNELFELYGKYRYSERNRNQDYSTPVSFITTAMEQIENYTVMFRKIKSLGYSVYIPGDGIGLGSYISSMLGIKYFSSEPNDIGRESNIQGLISSRNSFSYEDAKKKM